MPRVHIHRSCIVDGAHQEAGQVIDVSHEDAMILRSCGHVVEDDEAAETETPKKQRARRATQES